MTADLLVPPAPNPIPAELTPVAHYQLPDDSGGVYYQNKRQGDTTPMAHLMFPDDSGGMYYRESTGDYAPPPSPNPQANTEPVPLTISDTDHIRSVLISAAIWRRITRAGGLQPDQPTHTHFPNVFTTEQLRALNLPTRERFPEGQRVTLAGRGFHRYRDHAATLTAYHADPRTWIFEQADRHIAWLAAVTRYLTTLSHSPCNVIAAVYDSVTTDRPSAYHWDAWYSAIVQFDGAKQWSIGPDAKQVTTRPGDVLLIPEGLAHAVTTPTDPGHSRHLVFDIHTKPYGQPARPVLS